MPGRSKDRGHTKCSSWSSRLGGGRGANDPTTEKLTVTKPSHGGGEDSDRVVAPVKKNPVGISAGFW
jgi:hypothetical protein